MFLPAADQKYFDEFWVYASNGKHYNDVVKHMAYYILFGKYLGEDAKYNCESSCRSCSMYNKERCAGMSSYERWDGAYSAEKNTQVAASDFYFYERMNTRLQHHSTELCLRLGTYRVKKFQEYIYHKAQDSIKLHNKLNPKHLKEQLKELSPAIFTSKDIMELDTWLKFKTEKIDGEFLCSLLSDF